jgi:hypothetical protein
MAMEGNVDKLFADGMKKRGMTWTKEGANRMAKPIRSSLSGKLDAEKKGSTNRPGHTLPKMKCVSEKVLHTNENGDGWLSVSKPAVYGPDSDRPGSDIMDWPMEVIKVQLMPVSEDSHLRNPDGD